MANKAEFDIEILPDGKMKIQTGDLSGEHHVSADNFLELLQKLLGGPTVKKSLKGHGHVHSHGEAHHHHDH